jgi:hypothetical protein
MVDTLDRVRDVYLLQAGATFENAVSNIVHACGEGETLLKKWALYSFNDGEEHQKILLDHLMKKAEEGMYVLTQLTNVFK